ncbi:MAG: right-handed parallel beta-helix repeat-containing protein [Nanoarchaeota archaeon]|nr:right-handed parallel beta-helix repeat-containing protein [Nanoarchaeota archaeon]
MIWILFLLLLSGCNSENIMEDSGAKKELHLNESNFPSDAIFIAPNDPQANDANSGTEATYIGNGIGPKKSLNFSGLSGGVYVLLGNITIDEPIIITHYSDKPLIIMGQGSIDGGEVFTSSRLKRMALLKDYKPQVREVFLLNGRNIILDGLTIRNGFRHVINIQGQNIIIRNSKIHGTYEDAIKVVKGANNGVIEGNEITGFSSQAVDFFAGINWTIQNNKIHSPRADPVTGKINSNAIGLKGGAENVTIENNTIFNMGGDERFLGSIALGGTGDLDLYRRENNHLLPAAMNINVYNNEIIDYEGFGFSIVSCSNCTIINNKISARGGIWVDHDDNLPTAKEVKFYNNNLTIMDEYDDYAVMFFRGSIEDFESANNIYKLSTERFYIDGFDRTHQEFSKYIGTDETSIVK